MSRLSVREKCSFAAPNPFCSHPNHKTKRAEGKRLRPAYCNPASSCTGAALLRPKRPAFKSHLGCVCSPQQLESKSTAPLPPPKPAHSASCCPPHAAAPASSSTKVDSDRAQTSTPPESTRMSALR